MFNNLCAFVFKTRNYNDVTRSYFECVHTVHRLAVLFIVITNRTINKLNTHFVTDLMILNARKGPAIPRVDIDYNFKFLSPLTAYVSCWNYNKGWEIKILLSLCHITTWFCILIKSDPVKYIVGARSLFLKVLIVFFSKYYIYKIL